METTIFVDTIKGAIYEGINTFINNQINCSKANCQRNNIQFVFGRDYLFDKNVYFIYDIEKGFSKFELENELEDYFKFVELSNSFVD